MVTVHDRVALDNARKALPHLAFADDPVEAADQAGLILHLTGWDDYLDIAPERLKSHVAQPCIVDGRSTLHPARWLRAGWRHRTLGRP